MDDYEIMFMLTFSASSNGAEQRDLITTPHIFDIAGWSGGIVSGVGCGRGCTVGWVNQFVSGCGRGGTVAWSTSSSLGVMGGWTVG